jgi:hypothetical protein
MKRLGALSLMISSLAIAEGFSFSVASPVASQDFHFKTAAFVFRTEGCSSTEKPKISAIAEGINNNEWRSIALKVVEGSKPNVYAVFQTWPSEGQWLVDLEGSCGKLRAAALVPFTHSGFDRESTKFLSHPATRSEVEASLRALGQGGSK